MIKLLFVDEPISRHTSASNEYTNDTFCDSQNLYPTHLLTGGWEPILLEEECTPYCRQK